MYRDVFADSVSSGQRQGLETSVTIGAVLAFLESDHRRASRLLWWVRSRTLDAGLIMTDPWSYALYKNYARLLRDALPREEASRYRAEGVALTEQEAIALALRTVDETSGG